LSNELADVDGTFYPVFNYVQGNSVLYGAELSLDWHILDPLHFENKLSYVKGFNESINQPLPFIPPFHINSELSYQLKGSTKSFFKNTTLKVFTDIYSDQHEIDIFETTTKGAITFGAGINTEMNLPHNKISFFIIGNNLFNQKYFNHLSRLKEANINATGRNITVGLTIPLSLKK
jgi:iron complex outermembrane receptor protein